ncbi:hypothetical protein BDR03DRAFT_688706 [Suillus americanus]|nr:hypothetical protein BDR03DRAFT_688706 [Suillus americanus]
MSNSKLSVVKIFRSSKRISAGIYVNVDSRRRWKSVARVVSSDESVAWGDAGTLSLDASPELSAEIWAYPDCAGTLTNLAWACLRGYIQKDLQDIESITSLFREALALRPQGHPDHTLSIYHLIDALIWRYKQQTPPPPISTNPRNCAASYRPSVQRAPTFVASRQVQMALIP